MLSHFKTSAHSNIYGYPARVGSYLYGIMFLGKKTHASKLMCLRSDLRRDNLCL